MSDRLILMGMIGKPHGVRGAVHVHAYTEDPRALAELKLRDQRGRIMALDWTGDGIARVTLHEADGAHVVADRDAAALLANTRLFVERSQLPPADEDEFYLVDLIGLAAIGEDGATLGTIAAVHDYGAGASIELDDGRLIPFTRASVPAIDLDAKRATVVPPAEIEAELESKAGP
ncbi:ribosome maturation factor RimM [Acidiphilium sp. AL]|uniref:Ribosome maturation factor RimM n=1 Tax=Acidiphilium iwatense TaxID=768198 RepID=A0ABS9DRI8_9PROT|nr:MULTISPECIES: ribosome maturation factor RimM [Acidiphilium]MCF3945264.1 ribosome maturation factor RimM [Acidiphilium iwatense]MCU4159441.1 ribosome maturation factor RimM [Acidiphilium sp. AL]